MQDHPAPGKSFKRFVSFGALGFLCFHYSFSQINYTSVGARSAGLSDASVALNDSWSCFNNQAGLANVSNTTVGFSIENKYQLKELAQRNAYAVVPFHSGALGLSLRYFGFSNYYDIKYGIGYGLKLSTWMSAGAQINLSQNYIADGFGISNSVSSEFGLLITPFNHLRLGFHYSNPYGRIMQQEGNISIPEILRIGGTYNLSTQTNINLEWENWKGYNCALKGGLEFPLWKEIFFRCGYSTGSDEYSFGIGYKKNKIIADIAFTRHPVLGITPQLSIAYEF